MNNSLRETHNRLSLFIYKTKYIFISIFGLIIVSGVIYFVFQRINTKALENARTAIELIDEDYDGLIEEYPLHEIHVDLPEEEITSLLEQLSEVISNHKRSSVTQEAYFKKGQLYLLQKNFELAKIEFEASIEEDYSSILEIKALAILAAIAEEEEDLTQSIMYLSKITDNYPNSIETAHAIFNLGRISETLDATNSTQTAQGYYLSLLNNDKWETSSWASLAKSRLAMLGYTNIDEEDTESDEIAE